MNALFPDDNPVPEADELSGAAASGPASRVVGIAVNANVWRSFDYLWPDAFGEPQPGQRVYVPLGKGQRRTLGFVAEPKRRKSRRQLKTVAELVDTQTQFDDVLWELGQWMSRYYLTPLGMTLAAMVPTSVGARVPQRETVVLLDSDPAQWPTSLGEKQRRILDSLWEAHQQGVEGLVLEKLLEHAAASRDTLRRLEARKLLRREVREAAPEDLPAGVAPDAFALNDDQRRALGDITPRLAGGFSTTVLMGVTGSGKTEVYVRAIRKVIEAGKQAILMVPEIALATQTLQRLLDRLPRVAVLHSGLTANQRSHQWEMVRTGRASVVVGPRSAVFAPTRQLGLIIVDEEHEPSYKQDNAPPYHARDVAVMRGSLAEVPVILGSATPSLESTYNVNRRRYELSVLPRRVRNLPMPRLQVVNLREEVKSGRIELIGQTLTHRIAATLDRDEQVILLLNRRGFASYVFCPTCGWEYMCEDCSRPLVYHQATQSVRCHYCEHAASLPEQCPACGGKVILFGLGIQRIEEELFRKFPQARSARMDSDTMTSPSQFQKVFEGFAAGEIDVLMGTQMVAKGLDFPKVSLVGVISADTSLSIPDFRSSERTFQLIVQVAGRAGRGGTAGDVVVQTLHPDEPAVQFALNHDYDGFAAWELPMRMQTELPPFTRMIRFICRHADVDKAEASAQELVKRLRGLIKRKDAAIDGPSPAEILKIRKQFRFQVLLTCREPGKVQQILAPRMEDLCKNLPAEVLADVDALHLL